MHDHDLRDRLKSLEHEVRSLRDWAARLFTRLPTIPAGGGGNCQITIGCGLFVDDHNVLQLDPQAFAGAALVVGEDCLINLNPGDGLEVDAVENKVRAKLARGVTFTALDRKIEALLGNCLEFGASGEIDVSEACAAGDCNLELSDGLGLSGDQLFVKLAAGGGLEANGSGELQSLSRLFFGHASFNPNDATTYYFGCMPGLGADPTAGNNQFKVAVACTIRAVNLRIVRGSSGSSENVTYYIRVNNTTDHLISNTVQITSESTEVDNTSLSIALAAGDEFEIKIVTPTWTTNPTSVRAGGILTFAG